jgi:surface antigen
MEGETAFSAVENAPDGQSVHWAGVDAPVAVWYVPGLHGKQLSALRSPDFVEYVP